MTAEQIKALRGELSCTLKELATTLGVDPKDLAAWEAGEAFPTKRVVDQLAALRERGPEGVVRQPRGKARKTGTARLEDPRLWAVIRKLCDHPELFERVSKLSDEYPA